MICPNCEKEQASGVAACTNCGYNFPVKAVVAEKKLPFGKKEKSSEEKISADKSADKKPFLRKRRKFSPQAKLILILVGVAVILIIGAIIFVSWNNNSGKRVLNRLSDNLGKSVSDTEKSLGIDLASKSDFPFINDIDKFNYIYEPAKTVEIDGVNVPRWLIICHTDSAEVMQRVSYYDCTLLKKNSHGVKKSGKVNGAAVATGMTRKQAEKTINLEPFVIANYADGTQIRKYKYHYNDKATKNDTSYYLTIMFDKDGKVSAPVIEKENVFITDILTCE